MLYELLTNYTAAILGLLAVCLLLWRMRRPHNIPPGPPGLPIIGNLAALSGDPLIATEKLRRKYGDVYSLYLGSVLAVFVHGYKNLKEMLITRGDEYADRPYLFFNKILTHGTGLLGTSGQVWKEQRRFTLHTLRDFGFGRSSLESKIEEEVKVLLNCMAETKGEPYDPATLFHTSTANVISSIVFGKGFRHDDPTFKTYLGYMAESIEALGAAGALNFLPWLKYMPGDVFKYHRVLHNDIMMKKFLMEEIQSHKETVDPESPRDFIDAYLLEMTERQSEDEYTTFHEKQLLGILQDLFAAGTDTTATTIKWACLYMVTYPEIQNKLREELLSVVGKHRLPSIADRSNLPYTEATLLEIQRHADIVPLIRRAASVDTTIAGYSVPKGTVVIQVNSNALKDPGTWPEPDVFNPDRFLSSNGAVSKPEEFIPFSAGKRVCPGESLAKMELFLFLTAIIQRFTLRIPEGAPPPSLEGNVGLVKAPIPYELCAISNE